MPSVKRAVQDSDFSFDKALHVIFAGEKADDLGGPGENFSSEIILLFTHKVFAHFCWLLMTVTVGK